MTKVMSLLNGRNRPTISFIGFGEAAAAIVSGWDGRSGAVIKAYDSKTETGGSERAIMIERYALAGVEGCETIESALAGADAVFSLVTADQAQAAATSAAESLEEGALFLDCNSCAPQTKVRSEQSVAQSGGRYVDVAIMAPVRPLLHKTPMLASGPHACAAKGFMDQLAMSV
ncbi:MAG: NAD(P)-binding domain-containing protein, partial [Pseudomonadota bacterium]